MEKNVKVTSTRFKTNNVIKSCINDGSDTFKIPCLIKLLNTRMLHHTLFVIPMVCFKTLIALTLVEAKECASMKKKILPTNNERSGEKEQQEKKTFTTNHEIIMTHVYNNFYFIIIPVDEGGS